MRLHEYVAAARSRPFRAGTHDCARFAAGWVALRTGRDLARGWRYRSLAAGQRALEAAGYDDHIAYAAAHLVEVPLLRAREGDVVVVGDALGIAAGDHAYVLRAEGLGVVPMSRASRVFRVA